VAELYGLPVSGQFHHATGVLLRAHDLRAALSRSSARSEEVDMHTTSAGQRFRCRYLRWHHWSVFSTSDGHRYLGCAVCRKEHYDWGSVWDGLSGGLSGGAGRGGSR